MMFGYVEIAPEDLAYGDIAGKPKGSIFWNVAATVPGGVRLSNGLGNRRSGRGKVVTTETLKAEGWRCYRRETTPE